MYNTRHTINWWNIINVLRMNEPGHIVLSINVNNDFTQISAQAYIYVYGRIKPSTMFCRHTMVTVDRISLQNKSNIDYQTPNTRIPVWSNWYFEQNYEKTVVCEKCLKNFTICLEQHFIINLKKSPISNQLRKYYP